MNSLFRKVAAKLLSIPVVEAQAKGLWQLYVTERLDSIKGNNLHEVFGLIKANQLDILSDFLQRDSKALEGVVQMVLRNKVMVAEIGSWKGMSTAVLAKTVKDFNGRVFAVDHWKGSEEVPHHRRAKTIDTFSIFRYNMEMLGVWDTIRPMVMDSKSASEVFTDGLLDMVFIDADHRYKNIKQDIELWLPKIKKGGIICGHDCTVYYTKLGATGTQLMSTWRIM